MLGGGILVHWLMYPGGGIDVALVGSCLLHVWADGGEGGGEVVEGRRERSACVFGKEGDKLHPSPVFLEGRDEGNTFHGFLC